MNVTSTTFYERKLELRQVPFGHTVATEDEFNPGISWLRDVTTANIPTQTIEDNIEVEPVHYWVEPDPWFYSAVNQLTRNTSEPAWSHNGWNFVPVSISGSAWEVNGTVRMLEVRDSTSLK